MVQKDYVTFIGTSVYLKTDFDNGISAYMGFSPRSNFYDIIIERLGKDGETFLYSNDVSGPYYGFDAMFKALHEKLDELSLEGFPRDPEYVLDRLKNPPPQIVDLEMTDEEYLAQLAAKGTVR